MNKVILELLSIVIIGCIFTMCTKDEKDAPETDRSSDIKIADAVIDFRIKASDLQTYSSSNTEVGTTQENKIGNTIDYYIFDADGYFEESGTLNINPEESRYRSEKLVISAGDKYFYIFANKPANLFVSPVKGSHMTVFEKQIANAELAQLFYSNGGMVMGTLIGTKTTVAGTGTEQAPETIELTIGRMVAKVALVNEEPLLKGNLKGQLVHSQTKYRIINVPKNVYIVGQWEGPFKTIGSQVISPHFYTYNLNSDFTSNAGKTPSIGPETEFYTMENTNEVPRNETASCFQLAYQYVPDASEIYQVSNPGETGGSLTKNTFWVAEFSNGAKLIYDGNPYGVIHPEYGEVKKAYIYEYGTCFYIIPIEDDTEATASLRYAVIRNHFYRLKVNSISGLGYHTSDTIPDPTAPITKMQGIDFKVYVKSWENVELEVKLD
ncbi:MAG: fimbria major subunit [Tannerellaceae bacterium]|nr:fimbria major subunit [Tannerellaceae bacterium]